MSAIYVVSDLHLMDRDEPFLFNHVKEKAFNRLCEHILQSNGRLVLAGDVFDFTGMTPPQVGLREFFSEIVPPDKLSESIVSHAIKFGSTQELLISTREAFPKFFECLKVLALKKCLTYIPGNHDCDFMKVSSRDILAQVLEVPMGHIEWTDQFVFKDSLVVIHGNQYDAQNETKGSCKNPGFIFTSALYHGVLPALRMLGVDRKVLAAIPAVRPEEQVVSGLENYLDPDTLKSILVALTRLLAKNGYFHGLSRLPIWFLNHRVPVLSGLIERGVSVNRVKGLLPKDEKLILEARAGAEGLRESNLAFKNAVIVLGHTHELDRSKKYFNLGTWIDHLPSLHPESIGNPEVSLPVLRMSEDGRVEVYNVRDLAGVGSLEACPLIFNSDPSLGI